MFLILEAPARVVKSLVGLLSSVRGKQGSSGPVPHWWDVPVSLGCSVVPSQGNCFFAPAADPAVADPFVGSTATAKLHWLFLGLFCPSHLVYLPLEAWGDLQDSSLVSLETETDSSPARLVFV